MLEAAVSFIVMSTTSKTSNNLSFLAWNINVLSSKSLEDKSQHSEFLDVINNCDFVILVKLGPVRMLLK